MGGTIPRTSWELNSSTGASRSPRRTGYQDVDTEDEVELAQLPAVDKATITDSFDRVVTDPRLRLSELESHLDGLTRDERYLGE